MYDACNNTYALTAAGERTEDQEGLLCQQGMQEAPDAQGHTVQDRKG